MPGASYKPLLFNTTVRNPERIKSFLTAISEFDGQILTNEIMVKVAINVLKTGVYTTTRVATDIKFKWKNGIELTDEEAQKVYIDNPQRHGESGFDYGWPSRFDTWYKMPKELGFIWYWPGEKIKLSDTAKLLLDKENPQNEIIVFANAFAKYYRNNPFRNVLNKGTPLILLIETIKLLAADEDFGDAGIARHEIPILLCWRDGNAKSLYLKIKELRREHGYAPSNETVLDICYSMLTTIKRQPNSILRDYPDDFTRKMRLTGLFTLRGGGRFIDINKNELKAIDYLLDNYQTPRQLSTKKDFFDYIGKIDENFISTLSIIEAPTVSTAAELEKWAEHFDWDTIHKEILGLASPNGRSNDEVLKVINQPLRLEFLTAL